MLACLQRDNIMHLTGVALECLNACCLREQSLCMLQGFRSTLKVRR